MGKADDIIDNAVRHQVGMLRVTNGMVRNTLALLTRVERDVVRKIRLADPGSARREQLNALLDEIRRFYREEYASITGELTDSLADFGAYEAQYQARHLGQISGASFAVPSRAQILAAANARPFQGRHLREWMSGLSAAHARRVREAVRMGFAEGESTSSIVARIRGTRAGRYRDGILEISRRGAEAVVRTATTHFASVANQRLYESNDHLVEGVRWTSVLDGRTSIVCAGRDGKIYPLDKGPRPPAHINCRSVTVPILYGEGEPERVTFPQWLRRQPVDVQNEVLGPTRARAWRNGRIKIDRFVNNRGDVLALDDLARREGLDTL